MIAFRCVFVLLLVLAASVEAHAQDLSNLRSKRVAILGDTVQLDSMSLVPGSVRLNIDGNSVPDSAYRIIPEKGLFVWQPNQKPVASTVNISYRVFPFRFDEPFQHKNPKMVEPDSRGAQNPFVYTARGGENSIFNLQGLDKRGSISRGINFGNNQNLSVNSNLNLELSGKLNERISIAAAISDNNIPIQPEGNTQQLQEFDQVYITLFDRNSKLTAGDFQLDRPNAYFLNYFKRAQGGTFETKFALSNTDTTKGRMNIRASGAISRGKFARNIIQGVEGNQGPYRLRGAENETFIIVLSGTERVYIDGRLLVRGQEHDYVINYNTSELTFTAKQLITKDKRIIVEFQYSDQNYARSLVQFSDEFESEKLKLRFHLYSEQDGRNQPLQQEINDERRTILESVGDSVQLAFATGADTAEFNQNEILYERIDTVSATAESEQIYVFSSDSNQVLYRLSFSEVGPNQGNYVIDRNLANGRVYAWVGPDSNGVLQGNFEPVILLIAPKLNQMATLGGSYDFSKNTSIQFEGAVSNEDVNTFSGLDASDNQGFAFKANLAHRQALSKKDSNQWSLGVNAGIEYWSDDFTTIERIRGVEFDRDWNIRNLNLVSEQAITDVRLNLQRLNWGQVEVGVQSFNSAAEYQALKSLMNVRARRPGFRVNYRASLMSSDGTRSKTSFNRHKTLVEKKVGWLLVGYWDDLESNRISNPMNDSLLTNSYGFWEWGTYVAKADTSNNRYRIAYTQRYDEAMGNNDLQLATFGESVSGSFELVKNPKSVLKGKTTYRTLSIKNDSLTAQEPDNTFLNRLEYNLRLFKGTITSSSFYEIGSGLEAAREFRYLEVNSGQGAFAWTDYNGDGSQDLDEFEVARFPDQANFIKVFTPTDDYVRTFTNQFNQTFFFRPAAIWNNKKGWRKLVAKFSDQVAYRVDRKTNEESLASRVNPFESDIVDSTLIALNSSFRNTFYFQRSHPVYGIDLNYQDVRGKNLLTNGFESRSNRFQEVRTRWNINRYFTVNVNVTQGFKRTESDFFSTRNYRITYRALEPKITWQPGTKFRGSIFYRLDEKENDEDLGGETAENQTFGTDIKYNAVGKGSLLANLNFVRIRYNGNTGNALAFEMLDALQPGSNVTWSLSYQRTLAKYLQLSLNYNGRSSENVRTIHAGGVQVRAFF